jgi:hypothetical protein
MQEPTQNNVTITHISYLKVQTIESLLIKMLNIYEVINYSVYNMATFFQEFQLLFKEHTSNTDYIMKTTYPPRMYFKNVGVCELSFLSTIWQWTCFINVIYLLPQHKHIIKC